MKRYLVLGMLFVATVAQAQKLKKEDRQLMTDLQRHVEVLAHDSLQGRRTGTPGEQKAMAYIQKQFIELGIAPKGSNGYLQPFEIGEGKGIGVSTLLMVNERELQLHKEYFPLVYTGNINMEALPSRALQEPEMPWFWDLKETLEEAQDNPHFDIHAAIKAKIKEVQGKAATALFIYNTSGIKDSIFFDGKDRTAPVGIPVVYLTAEAVQKHFNDESATLDIKLKTSVEAKVRTGSNVIGFIDNGAANTVVVGAHFDHLGLGEAGSMAPSMAGQIHNGADDNASGTAALLELAHLLKGSKAKGSNYLFIAFSGEELGLYGSKYFTENPTIDLSTVAYMINMDMLGRLNTAITIGGYGTSPQFGAAYAVKGKKALYAGPLQYKFDTTKQTQVYELALSDYRGKITGYAYATFVANDTFYYSIRRVKAAKKGGNLVVEDADMLANNFPKGPDKGVRRITQVPINHLVEEDTLSDFNATWKTTATSEFYSLPGNMTMQRSNDSSGSALLAHLTELRIQPTANERATIAKKEEKPKAPQKGSETFSKTPAASKKITTPPAPVTPTTIPYNQRGQKLLQTFEVAGDSLILSFYDNGVVDGDVISVYVNGQSLVSNAKLLEAATKKTVHLNTINGNEIELVLVAETLGEMPPNTGLLVVQDGAKRYEVRFSADLQTNAAIVFKKRN